MTFLLVATAFGLTCLPPCSGQNLVNRPAEQDLLIKGIQKISKQFGIVHTADSIYSTRDNGSSWTRLPLDVDRNSTIAGVKFSGEFRGYAVIHDSAAGNLILAETLDGGNSWQRQATPSDTFGDDAYLRDAMIRISTSGIDVTFALATSSNFEGLATFRTVDGGVTWTRKERVVAIRRSDESEPLRSGDWTMLADGSCAAAKRNCIQLTTLVNGSGRDITPPPVIKGTRQLRDEIRRDAEGEFLFLPPGGSVRISLNRGFDKCTAAPASQMQTWWDLSPLYDSNIYISGRNRGCSQPQLTAAWVNQVSSMGWGLTPTIVGYQSPCSSCTACSKHSFDVTTAETQGRGEADIAIADANNIGLTQGTVLYYDMERYDETVSTPGCRVATVAFLKGWTDRVKELGYISGVYGSPTNAVADWIGIPAPSRMDAVWLARWDNIPSVWTYALPSPVVPTDVWNNHQRIKQWQAPHNETWGGVTFNIDGNIADGPVAGVAVAKNKNADFDGDRRADPSVFRLSDGVWYVRNSNGGATYTQFGVGTDIPVPGDYDGDGRTDHCVFRPSDGSWHILTKAGTYSGRFFGQNGDIPAAGDFNGDGRTDIAIFRPSSGVWYIANSDSQGTYSYVFWGITGDKPVVGDYDGDGRSDVGVFRPSSGVWYMLRSSNGSFSSTQFGVSTDMPAQSDMDGDGKTDIVAFRPSIGVWYILRSADGGVSYAALGAAGDLPVPADYEGDGKDDVAVFRPSSGVWYVFKSSGGLQIEQWGIEMDMPVPNAYLPR